MVKPTPDNFMRWLAEDQTIYKDAREESDRYRAEHERMDRGKGNCGYCGEPLLLPEEWHRCGSAWMEVP